MYEKYEGYMIRRMREEEEKNLARQKKDPLQESFDKLMSTIDRIEKKLDKYVEQQCSKS
jgi:hypothetical protein